MEAVLAVGRPSAVGKPQFLAVWTSPVGCLQVLTAWQLASLAASPRASKAEATMSPVTKSQKSHAITSVHYWSHRPILITVWEVTAQGYEGQKWASGYGITGNHFGAYLLHLNKTKIRSLLLQTQSLLQLILAAKQFHSRKSKISNVVGFFSVNSIVFKNRRKIKVSYKQKYYLAVLNLDFTEMSAYSYREMATVTV